MLFYAFIFSLTPLSVIAFGPCDIYVLYLNAHLELILKSPLFLSTKFVSCELPISPLISFHFLSPYKFCVNSIPWCVVICYHPHLVVHRSCLDTHLHPYSLKKIPSLPPQFESGYLPIWPLDAPSPFPFAGPVLTPSFMVLISFVLCLFTSSPTSLSVNTFKKTLVISIPLPYCLPWTYPLKPSLVHPCSRIVPHLLHHWWIPPSSTPCKFCLKINKYIFGCVFDCYHLNPCHPSIFTLMIIMYPYFKAASPILFQEWCLTHPALVRSLFLYRVASLSLWSISPLPS